PDWSTKRSCHWTLQGTTCWAESQMKKHSPGMPPSLELFREGARMAARQATGLNPAVDSGAGKVFIHFTMSMDGFIADAGGGLDWAFGFAGPSPAAVRKITDPIGAMLAGRHGYDLAMIRGDMKIYGGAWTGPQFVLTHRPGDTPADPSITF